MSDVSFPVSVPPIPIPRLSKDEGVPLIPQAEVYRNGSYGDSSIVLDTPPEFIPTSSAGGLPRADFPLEVIASVNSDSNIEIKTTASVVYDYTSSAETPVVVDINEFTAAFSSADIYFVYLILTLNLNSGKEVTATEIVVDTQQPTLEESEIIITIAEVEVTKANGIWGIEKLTQKTTGAIFYPPTPAYEALTVSSGYLQTGLGNTETATPALPSEITGYILNVKEYFNLKVGDSGSEVIDIDSTSVISGRTIGVREIKNEAGTATGNVLATQDVTRGVEWAKYNGSSTAAGSLEIGGANVDSKITDTTLTTENDNGKFTFMSGNASLPNNRIEFQPFVDEYSEARFGGSSANTFNAIGNIEGGNSFATGSGGFTAQESGVYGTYGHKGLDLNNDDQKVTISCDDLATVSGALAKFRSVKVCNNGVPATAYILMTDPVNDP